MALELKALLFVVTITTTMLKLISMVTMYSAEDEGYC